MAVVLYNLLPHRSYVFVNEALATPISEKPLAQTRFWRTHGVFRDAVTSLLVAPDQPSYSIQEGVKNGLFVQAYQLLEKENPSTRVCASSRCNFVFIPTDSKYLPRAVAVDTNEERRAKRQAYLDSLCPHEPDHSLSTYYLLSEAARTLDNMDVGALVKAIKRGRLQAVRMEGVGDGRGTYLVPHEEVENYRLTKRRGRPPSSHRS